jgi:hypothetical protein
MAFISSSTFCISSFPSDTNTFIKDNLQNIIDGKFDDKFETDYLKMMLELSFLFNHLRTDKYYIIFEYSGQVLKINAYESHSMMHSEDGMLHYIRNEETFKSCYNLFLRDVKLNQLLRNDTN